MNSTMSREDTGFAFAEAFLEDKMVSEIPAREVVQNQVKRPSILQGTGDVGNVAAA